MIGPTMPGCIYRAYDADGRLLYIGSTIEIEARLRYHAEHAPWWPFRSAITIEPFADIRIARLAERDAIYTEHPRWNVTGRSPNHPDGFISQAYGRFAAPWLRDEIAEWRRSKQKRSA